LWRWAYTGDGFAPENEYIAAKNCAGDWVYDNSPVRGFYGGMNPSIMGGKVRNVPFGWQGGFTGGWTIDSGYFAQGQLALGFRDGIRDPRTGQYVSGTLGIVYSKGYSQDEGWYSNWGQGFAGTQQGDKYWGGGHVGQDVKSGNLNLGINYGPAHGGLIIDPSKLKNLFDFEW